MQTSVREITTYQTGVQAEQTVAAYLRRKGFSLLAMRFRTEAGEIDLVVNKGEVIHFIEVKRRRSLAEARQCISVRQRQRIAKAAEIFLAQQPEEREWISQFDAVFVVGKTLHWLPDAWRVEDL